MLAIAALEYTGQGCSVDWTRVLKDRQVRLNWLCKPNADILPEPAAPCNEPPHTELSTFTPFEHWTTEARNMPVTCTRHRRRSCSTKW